MNKRKFKQILKKNGFELIRKNRHLIYSNGTDIFPLSSSGSEINRNIVRIFEKRFGVNII